MSWERVPQQRVFTPATRAPVSLSLGGGARRETRLNLTVGPEVCEALGWHVGLRMGLEVGRAGEALGWVRIAPTTDQAIGQRQLRMIPRSPWLTIGLEVPDDLARWTAPREAAEHKLIARSRMLVAKLPWDLSGEPPASAEAA